MAAFDVAAFRAEIDTEFVIDPGGGREPVAVKLVEVTEGKSGGGFQRFSVLFHGPVDRFLEQGTYAFQHDSLGSLTLFIVPIVGSNAERIVYEAVFAQRIESQPAP
jgi:hypothetical protein